MRRLVLIDNYDSFTYNLYQAFAFLGAEISVFYNDCVMAEQVEDLRPTHIVISPGPGTPEQAGVSNEIIQRFHGRVPILGVCLGHQCVGHVFGASITRASVLMHGKTSMIVHDGSTLFTGLSNPFAAARYHSLIVAEDLPEQLEISAYTPAGEIMGLRVKGSKTEGVQFHPESYMTKEGMPLMKNFLGCSSTTN
jgi:anthranilate synthase/aminodeoxychorismate synthase-like glutamine amidotransferase